MSTRTCSTCSCWNHEPAGLEPACWAGVLLVAGASQREPGPTDYCELHSTHEEAAGYIAAAYATDPELRAIIQRQLAGENEFKHIQNQAASEVITAEVLGKLRKGGVQ